MLELIRGLLDDAFANMELERLAEVWHKWESAHSQYGQPVVDWCANLRRFRMELQEQGRTRIIDEGLACKMLLCSGLSQKGTSQVFYQ